MIADPYRRSPVHSYNRPYQSGSLPTRTSHPVRSPFMYTRTHNYITVFLKSVRPVVEALAVCRAGMAQIVSLWTGMFSLLELGVFEPFF